MSQKNAVKVQFIDDAEKEQFKKKAKTNNRSMSNEFRVSADLPEIKAGGKRENAGKKKDSGK